MYEANQSSEDKSSEAEIIRPKVTTHTSHTTNNFVERLFDSLSIIIVGVIFLLNTTGVLAWSFWGSLIKFWPLLIISLGISIALSFNDKLKVLAKVITFTLFAIAVSSSIFFSTNNFSNIPLREDDILVDNLSYSDVNKKQINGQFDTGDINISDVEEGYILKLNSKSIKAPEIKEEYHDKSLTVSILGKNNENALIANNYENKYNLLLAKREVETAAKVKNGVGNINIELDSLKVSELEIENGVGNTKVKLTKNIGTNEGKVIIAKLKSGIGDVELNIPFKLGIKIDYKVGVGNVEVNSRKVVTGSGNGSFKSDNYDTAEQKIHINTENGVGNIRLFVNY